MITIGTTIQQDTEITFLKTELSGFTRYLNANPFAILDTKNQSQHIAKIYAIGNPNHPALMDSIDNPPMCNDTLYMLIQNTIIKHMMNV